ncbi:MAG TPA: response regulator transcription factor [Cerasibacillus sp.]|uniref:response regulator transcription factor n=1 Tax=Cerasibacillus sp. TaxID=2498711 RepID=UPI002F3E5E93
MQQKNNYINNKNGNNLISVALVDKSLLYRDSLKVLFDTIGSPKLVAYAPTFEQLNDLYKKEEREPFDILLVEIGDKPIYSIHSIKRMVEKNPNLNIIVLTEETEDIYAVYSIRAGVKGYVLKTMGFSALLEAIQHVYDGNFYFNDDILKNVIYDYQDKYLNNGEKEEVESHMASPILSRREREVLELIIDGKTNSEIAQALAIKEVTVKNHVYNLMQKMNVEHRTGAVLKAIKQGWVAI